MYGFAARTLRLPICRLLSGHRYDGHESRIAHELEHQRRPGFASAPVAAQTPRSLVAVENLLAGRTRCLPVARLHDRLIRIVAGTRLGTDSHGNRFPYRA